MGLTAEQIRKAEAYKKKQAALPDTTKKYQGAIVPGVGGVPETLKFADPAAAIQSRTDFAKMLAAETVARRQATADSIDTALDKQKLQSNAESLKQQRFQTVKDSLVTEAIKRVEAGTGSARDKEIADQELGINKRTPQEITANQTAAREQTQQERREMAIFNRVNDVNDKLAKLETDEATAVAKAQAEGIDANQIRAAFAKIRANYQAELVRLTGPLATSPADTSLVPEKQELIIESYLLGD